MDAWIQAGGIGIAVVLAMSLTEIVKAMVGRGRASSDFDAADKLRLEQHSALLVELAQASRRQAEILQRQTEILRRMERQIEKTKTGGDPWE